MITVKTAHISSLHWPSEVDEIPIPLCIDGETQEAAHGHSS
jgi:hypothetical protein